MTTNIKHVPPSALMETPKTWEIIIEAWVMSNMSNKKGIYMRISIIIISTTI